MPSQDFALSQHAMRHATGQPDEITPASIGAATEEDLTAGLAGITAATVGAYATRNVRAYGATGNGSDDDTAAIQAAIDAGGIVTFDPGTYRITAPLVLKTGTILQGCHAPSYSPDVNPTTAGSKIIAANGYTGTSMVSVAGNASGCAIYNMLICGNNQGSDVHGIGLPQTIPGELSLRMRDVQIAGMSGAGMEGSLHVGQLYGVHIGRCGSNAVRVTGSNRWVDVKVVGMFAYFNARSAIYFAGGHTGAVEFSMCRFERSGQTYGDPDNVGGGFNADEAGVRIRRGQFLSFLSCTTDANTGAGFHIDGQTNAASQLTDISFTQCRASRDGGGDQGGTFEGAGFLVSAFSEVEANRPRRMFFTSCTTSTGRSNDGGGSGPISPRHGLSNVGAWQTVWHGRIPQVAAGGTAFHLSGDNYGTSIFYAADDGRTFVWRPHVGAATQVSGPQTLSLAGSTLSLSNGGGAVTLPSGGGGTGAVSSVNGQTGTVSLDAADVGALPSTYTPPAQEWGVITGKPNRFPVEGHSHWASDIVRGDGGVVPADALGDGSTDSSTVLHGDGQWRPLPSGGGGGDSTLTVKVSAYCTGNGSDEASGLRAAVAESLSTGGVLECDVPGEIGLGSTVVLGDERANSQQVSILTMVGALKVKATVAMQRLITFSGTVNTLACDIEANGDNKANFAIYGKNFGRSTFGRFHAYGAPTAGIYWEPSGNSNAWSIEKLRVTGCGSRHTASATVTGRQVTGSWLATGDGAPYTTWTFATAMPASLTINERAAPVVIMGDGRFMQVKRVVNSTTIEVFNEDKPMSTTETLTLLSAAVNIPFYGDIGIFSIGNADVRDNPNAAAMAYGGYGGHVDMWAQQNNYAGVMLLERATGISFSHFYTELSGVWLVVRSVALTGLVVGPGANAAQSNWQGMDRSWMNPAGRNRQPQHWIMSKPSGSAVMPSPAVPIDAPELNPGTRNITPGTVQAYRKTAGGFAMRIDNNYTTSVGQVMLAAPDTGGGVTITLSLLSGGPGHTIEGSSTWTKTGVVGSVMLTYWLEGSTWRVRVTAATL